MEVKSFKSGFDQNLLALQHIEESFMRPLAELVELPEGLYHIEDTAQLIKSSSEIQP